MTKRHTRLSRYLPHNYERIKVNSQFLRNFPIPEGHMAFLAVGVALHRLMPNRISPPSWKRNITGWLILTAGVLVSGWAAATARDMDIERPDRIVSTGPYAFSRNPMYAGWNLVYMGIALLINSIWQIILLPGLILFTHYFVVLPEERQMERQFGEAYFRYRARVNRYL
jgi:protein-S-isoprenylcysteine O-methyltransferase Ste14